MNIKGLAIVCSFVFRQEWMKFSAKLHQKYPKMAVSSKMCI